MMRVTTDVVDNKLLENIIDIKNTERSFVALGFSDAQKSLDLKPSIIDTFFD